MVIHEVVLKTYHGSFFADLTRRFPSTTISIWCNRENDVIEVVVRNSEEYPIVMKELRKNSTMNLIDEISDEHRLYLNIHQCNCMNENTLVRHVDELEILVIFPQICENGWIYHRLIVFKHENLEELLTRLERLDWFYQIVRKVPFDGYIASSLTLSAHSLLSELTEKQMEAILTAYRYGYYNLPRSADLQEIAAKKHVPRTTFQNHLKKAENKLVGALVPHMQLLSYTTRKRKNKP
ncbi:MAG: helix-turn-helix domain-containing protein [Candidatus Bathyarchaeota archaeon]|nr:MAG: helix-turn-helix domain-containing protein [Candidatus Bathyarchaeota archaeon]